MQLCKCATNVQSWVHDDLNQNELMQVRHVFGLSSRMVMDHPISLQTKSCYLIWGVEWSIHHHLICQKQMICKMWGMGRSHQNSWHDHMMDHSIVDGLIPQIKHSISYHVIRIKEKCQITGRKNTLNTSMLQTSCELNNAQSIEFKDSIRNSKSYD